MLNVSDAYLLIQHANTSMADRCSGSSESGNTTGGEFNDHCCKSTKSMIETFD